MPKRETEAPIRWVKDDVAALLRSRPGTSERRLAWLNLNTNAQTGLGAEWVNLGHDEAKAEARAKAKKSAKKGRK